MKNPPTTLCYAAKNRNESLRLAASSGGVFSLLAHTVLSENGLVYGAAYDAEEAVRHIRVSSEKELKRLYGAKYAPSDISGIYEAVRDDLEKGRRVLFSGTPCQTAGLSHFLKKDTEQLLLVDLVCHGVPTGEAWKSYLAYRQREDGQESPPSRIDLRSKATGWSHYGYAVSFDYPSGFHYEKRNTEDSYLQAFTSNLTLRTACLTCSHKGLDRVSDFTLGDLWGVWDILPEMDDDKGVSLVMVHSEKGRRLWQTLQKEVECQEITPDQAVRQNPSILRSSPAHPRREEALTRMREEGWEAIDRILTEEKRKRAGGFWTKFRKLGKKRPT